MLVRFFWSWPFFVAFFASYVGSAQSIENWQAYKDQPGGGYGRAVFENDFFLGSDRYYTQGLDLEMVTPLFNRLITNKLLYNPRFSYTRYGIGIQHNAFTPGSVSDPSLLIGDRPYAGVLTIRNFAIAIDTLRRQRFYTSAVAGVIGKAAIAGDIQGFVHKVLGNYMPNGWLHQIRNDIILNYDAAYEKELLRYRHFFLLSAAANVNVGTLLTGAGVSTTVMLGHFHSPFSDERASRRHLHFYIYDQPSAYLPGYNATLQGGVFNRASPYVIRETDISRPVLRNRLGFVAAWQNVCVEYFMTTLTREFATGDSHSYGGLQLSIGY